MSRTGSEVGPGPIGEAVNTFTDRIDHPLMVVTVVDQLGNLSGCLAGFITQCSIQPPDSRLHLQSSTTPISSPNKQRPSLFISWVTIRRSWRPSSASRQGMPSANSITLVGILGTKVLPCWTPARHGWRVSCSIGSAWVITRRFSSGQSPEDQERVTEFSPSRPLPTSTLVIRPSPRLAASTRRSAAHSGFVLRPSFGSCWVSAVDR